MDIRKNKNRTTLKGVIYLGRRSKFTPEFKIEAVLKFLNGNDSKLYISKIYGISNTTLENWIRIYQSYGSDGFYRTGNNHYSKELKLFAVQDYIGGKGSLAEICKKYKILDKRQLRDWIKVYNGHKKFKGHNRSGGKLMTKGRNTTIKERIEIVTDCIGCNNDYNGIAEKYSVSYQQVYTWVKKFKEHGADGLIDRRGKEKPEDKLTDVDRLKAENKRLEAEKRRLQMELDLIKKLRELKAR